jgi:dihydrodipicolinate synthase/N-acetylneuraminate lyase
MKLRIDMNKGKKYQGVVVPAITPLTADLSLDEEAVGRLFTFFREHEVLPFILGTTGEAPSLSVRVKQQYIRVAARLMRGGGLLYAGISSNCLEDSVELAKYCFGEGVDVVVATLPSYYALTGDQMKKYFERLADSIGGPLIIYNIPATTHQSVPLQVIDELSQHPGVVGTKDSERDEERLKKSLRLWAGRSDFSHFLGWAARSSYALLNGGDGLVPSTANFRPDIYRDMMRAVGEDNAEKLADLQQESDRMGDGYQSGRTLGESVAALKLIMEKKGICQHHMMPPL